MNPVHPPKFQPGEADLPAGLALTMKSRIEPHAAAVRMLAAALAGEDRHALTDGGEAVASNATLARWEGAGEPKGPTKVGLQNTKRRTTDTPASAIIRAHWRRRVSLEETMLALYYGNLSPHCSEETARVLWGEKLSGAVVAACVEQVRDRLHAWLQQPLAKSYAYVFLDTIRLKQRLAGQSQETWMHYAVGVTAGGLREVLGVQGETDAGPVNWRSFLQELKRRGLNEAGLFIGGLDDELGKAVAAEFLSARRQVCLTQLERKVLASVPSPQLHLAMAQCEALRAHGGGEAARAGLLQAVRGLRQQGLKMAAGLLERALPEALGYSHFPSGHWNQLRTPEVIRRAVSPFRERIRVIGPIAEPEALRLLAAAHLRQVARAVWGRRRWLKE